MRQLIGIKVGAGRNEAEAIRVMARQAEILKRRGLWSTWGVYREPLNHTRDGYLNRLGPWGVYLVKRKAPNADK